MTQTQALLTIFFIAFATLLTRALPFWVIHGQPSAFVRYLGVVLPGAVIAMLVVYCFKSATPLVWPHALPELIAGAYVVSGAPLEAQPGAEHRRRHRAVYAAGAAGVRLSRFPYAAFKTAPPAGAVLLFWRMRCIVSPISATLAPRAAPGPQKKEETAWRPFIKCV